MKPLPFDELCVEYLRESHDISFFCCRNEDLNDFLKSDAKKSQEDLISRTYLCLWQNSILGYLTLVTDTIEVKLIEKDDCVDGYPYPRYPSIKIARLAVDERFEVDNEICKPQLSAHVPQHVSNSFADATRRLCECDMMSCCPSSMPMTTLDQLPVDAGWLDPMRSAFLGTHLATAGLPTAAPGRPHARAGGAA